MFSTTVERVFAALWALQPGWAVYLGHHKIDRALPDWTEPGDRRQLDVLSSARSELVAFDAGSPDETIDRDLLVAQIDKTRFEWEELRLAQRNPMP